MKTMREKVTEYIRETYSVEPDYPFKGHVRFTVEAESPVSFELRIRIPGTAERAFVNNRAAEPGSVVSLPMRYSAKRPSFSPTSSFSSFSSTGR